MKIRQGKDIILRWKITTNGEALPLEGRNLTLILSTPNGRERVLSYTTEGDTISTRLFGKEITLLGDYTLTLWENRGEQGQTAVDAVDAFELVKYTTMEEDSSPCSNLEAEILSLSGDLGVFQQGTTTEKNEQVDKNTEDIAELQQDMADAKDDIHALGNSLNELGKADASLREEIVNIKDKNAEQDEEITSLLNILEGKLDIKDLGSGRSPDQAVSEIINYVRSNNIKSALVFKYIDTDNSSTFGICISRMGTSGWIIYLVARKGLEVLKFNSYGSRETWNEYGGVLRHDMNSVADEQLECLSIKGIKSVLATKQDALISGQNIKSINGQSIMGSGNIKIEAGITEEEKAEINAKIEGKADNTEFQQVKQQQLQLTVKDNGNIVLSNLNGQSQEFMPATPSGDPMHWAYVSAGAEYNDSGEDKVKTGMFEKPVIHKNGYWYLNEIGDLTNEDMRIIIIHSNFLYSYNNGDYLYNTKIRTLLPATKQYTLGSSAFRQFTYVETIKIPTLYTHVNVSNSLINYTFYNGIRRLRKIITPIICQQNTRFDETDFLGPILEDVEIHQLSSNIFFQAAPNLSKESVKYMIDNAAPTSAITITLHPDAYARLAEDADIVAALEAKPLVTLVSA